MINIKQKNITPFNSSLETGVRSLVILFAGYPKFYDIQWLIEMDYLVVHSADICGPESLHAPLPNRSGELLVRRSLIENGLNMMISKNLIKRIFSNEGFCYMASEEAAPFLRSLTSTYIQKLMERAYWVAEKFNDKPVEDIRKIIKPLIENWSSQFQQLQIPGSQ